MQILKRNLSSLASSQKSERRQERRGSIKYKRHSSAFNRMGEGGGKGWKQSQRSTQKSVKPKFHKEHLSGRTETLCVTFYQQQMVILSSRRLFLLPSWLTLAKRSQKSKGSVSSSQCEFHQKTQGESLPKQQTGYRDCLQFRKSLI